MSSDIQFLQAGSQLAQWVREGGVPQRGGIAAQWLYRWRGYWFERALRSEKQLISSSPQQFPDGHGLLLVMGLWRSGTTLLHEYLTTCEGFTAPTTSQCMNPAAFALGGIKQPKRSVSRPMDAGTIRAESPQEDEFALLALGVPSSYRFFIDPRRWSEFKPAFDPHFWAGLPAKEWLEPWLWFLRACAGQSKHLAVKSPNHCFRWPAIHHALPSSRYVLVLREPLATWQSNCKMWRAMCKRYALWRCDEQFLEGLLLEAFSRYAQILDWTLGVLQPSQCMALSFEDLVASPELQLQAICRRFGYSLNPNAGSASEPKEPERYLTDTLLLARYGVLFERIKCLQSRVLQVFGERRP